MTNFFIRNFPLLALGIQGAVPFALLFLFPRHDWIAKAWAGTALVFVMVMLYRWEKKKDRELAR